LLERGGREIAFMQPELQFQNEIFRSEFGVRGIWLTVEVEDPAGEHAPIKELNVPAEVELRTENWGETRFFCR
jgi:hypothetical protein